MIFLLLLNLANERNVIRKEKIIFHNSRHELLSHRSSEFLEEAKGSRDDKDEIVEQDDDEVPEPLDRTVLAEQIEVGNSCKKKKKIEKYDFLTEF